MRGMGRDPLRVYESIREIIGNPEDPTPMVKVGRMNPNPDFSIYLKLEWFNPFGSIKDRTANFLLKGLQRDDRLNGRMIVEPSSGNTGIALVALANLLGIRTTITVPEAVPQEKQLLLRLLGATLWPTPDDLCPKDHPKDGAIALALSIANDPKTGASFVMPNQYENPDNVKAHYETTGPEIWGQTEGEITHFYAGFGTCGTITGAGRFLKEKKGGVRVIAIMPRRNHRLPGLKNFDESKKPSIVDESVIDRVITVSDEDAYRTTIRLAREESILAGPSTGAILHAALSMAGEEKGLAVVISPDSIFKYMSYMEEWLGHEGLPGDNL